MVIGCLIRQVFVGATADGGDISSRSMAGPDTFRGCSFQAAYSVRLALDVVEGLAEVLQLEGDTDIHERGARERHS